MEFKHWDHSISILCGYSRELANNCTVLHSSVLYCIKNEKICLQRTKNKEQTDVSTTESTLILSGSSPDTRGSWPINCYLGYYVVLYCNTLYFTVSYCNIWYFIVIYYNILQGIELYCKILYFILIYKTLLYFFLTNCMIINSIVIYLLLCCLSQ